jgi:hypothetical protein
MKLPVIIDPEAQQEWDEGAAWYEHREHGVGLRFNSIVRQHLEKISVEYERFPFFTKFIQKAKIVG